MFNTSRVDYIIRKKSQDYFFLVKTHSLEPGSFYVYLSVENIISNLRAIIVYVFHFGLIIIQFDCCKGQL